MMNDDMNADFDAQLSQLISMGFDPVLSRNALEAAGGNTETAIEILQHDQTQEVDNTTTTSNNETAASVLDQWSKQLLGDKQPIVKQKALEAGETAKKQAVVAGQTAKTVWSMAVSRAKEMDEKYKLSTSANDALKTCDEKFKEFDAKHDVSGKATKAVSTAGNALSKTVETAKKSLSEQR